MSTRTETIDMQNASVSFNVEEGVVIEHENGTIILDATRYDIIAAFHAARQTPEAFAALLPPSLPEPEPTRSLTLIRHVNVRRHTRFFAEVPEAMLSDRRYFDEDNEPTPDFDQWMCDNGVQGDIEYDDIDNDELSYELDDDDYRECAQCGEAVLTLSADDLCDGCVEENEGTVICPNCGERVVESDMSHWPNLAEPISMCSSCYHDARRGGWEPGQ